MPIKLDVIALTVREMAPSFRFYRMLGVPIPEGVEDQPHVDAEMPGSYRMSWDTEALMQEIYPGWTPPAGQRITLAFRCDSPDEVDALYRQIVDAGFAGAKEPWDAFWGQRYAVVTDPDGNHVDLFAALPA